MAAVPKTRKPKKQYERIEPKQFKEKLSKLQSDLDNLIELSSAVAEGKAKKVSVLDAAGNKIGKRDVNHLRSEYVKQMKELSGFYTAAYRRKRAPGAKRRGGTGFRTPIMVSDSLRDFFANAELGYSDPTDANSAPLRDVIQLLVNRDVQAELAQQVGLADIPGITTPALLTPLFSIYAAVNQLTDLATNNRGKSEVDKNRQYLGADAAMKQYFADTFRRLTARGAHETAKGTTVPAFDPNNFKYADFQSLVKYNRRSNDGTIKEGNAKVANPAGPALSAEEQALLAAPEIKERLDQEQESVSGTLAATKELNKEAMNQIRQEKRKQKAQAKKAGK
jgi:hypothetical protein